MELFKRIVGLKATNTTLWYLVSVIAFNIVSFIVFSLIHKLTNGKKENNKKIELVTSSILSWFVYSFAFQYVGLFVTRDVIITNNVLPLSLLSGMIFQIFEDRLSEYIKRNKVLLFFVFSILTYISVMSNNSVGKSIVFSIPFVWRNINLYDWLAPLLFAISINLLVINEDINSKILHYLGKYSLYTYALHYPLMTYARNMIYYNDYLFVLVYLVALMISTYCLSYLIDQFSHLIKKLSGSLKSSLK